jgi:hypothetical protein
MKRIPLMLFCLAITVVSCKKEKPEPTNTPQINEPSALGEQIVGMWTADSTRYFRTSDGHIFSTDPWPTGTSREIAYISDTTYSETNYGQQGSATTWLVLNNAGYYRYKNSNGAIGETKFYYTVLDEHHMVTDSYWNSNTTRRDYLSR